jgi:hypothetical protein
MVVKMAIKIGNENKMRWQGVVVVQSFVRIPSRSVTVTVTVKPTPVMAVFHLGSTLQPPELKERD